GHEPVREPRAIRLGHHLRETGAGEEPEWPTRPDRLGGMRAAEDRCVVVLELVCVPGGGNEGRDERDDRERGRERPTVAWSRQRRDREDQQDDTDRPERPGDRKS